MILVTCILADDGPPFRTLWEGELPAVPLPDEPFAFNGRIYRVVERSWRFGTVEKMAKTLEPIHDTVTVLACGLMLTQVGGPPHVMVSPGSATAQ